MQRDNAKKEKVQQVESHVFQDHLPEEIIRELTPEIRRQYFLWDEIAKREVQLYPWIVLPLIDEVFHRKYPENVEINLLSTEYAVKRIHKNGEKVLQSVILYLDSSKNTPDFETCTIHFRENETYRYQVPVLKVQDYSTDLIRKKHLNMLIPFLPIRFRQAVNSPSKDVREKARKSLTELLAECIIILKQEKENGTLTESAGNDVTEFLSCACDHLFAEDLSLIKEVHEIMEPAVKLRREIVQELKEDIRDLQESNRDLQESNRNLQKSNKNLQERLNGMEQSLERFIQKSRLEGKSREETGKSLQEIFSLSAKEAAEKLEQHWRE